MTVMSEKNEQSEPSMEDILASIRRIISEDDDAAADKKDTKGQESKDSAEETEVAPTESPDSPKATEAAKDEEQDDVLELTDIVEEEDAEADTGEPESAKDDADDDKIAVLPNRDQTPNKDQLSAKNEEAETTMSQKEKTESVVSGGTSSAVTAALADFAGELNKGKDDSESTSGGGALELIVRQALEPHLKAWLDDNLEPIVERLVKEELKRMARRAEDY